MSSVPIGSNRYANYSVSVNFIWYSLSLIVDTSKMQKYLAVKYGINRKSKARLARF